MTDETRKMIVNVHAFSLLLMKALMKCTTVVRSINIILNVSMYVFVIVLSELVVKLLHLCEQRSSYVALYFVWRV